MFHFFGPHARGAHDAITRDFVLRRHAVFLCRPCRDAETWCKATQFLRYHRLRCVGEWTTVELGAYHYAMVIAPLQSVPLARIVESIDGERRSNRSVRVAWRTSDFILVVSMRFFLCWMGHKHFPFDLFTFGHSVGLMHRHSTRSHAKTKKKSLSAALN